VFLFVFLSLPRLELGAYRGEVPSGVVMSPARPPAVTPFTISHGTWSANCLAEPVRCRCIDFDQRLNCS
jgi:hypothetical protein